MYILSVFGSELRPDPYSHGDKNIKVSEGGRRLWLNGGWIDIDPQQTQAVQSRDPSRVLLFLQNMGPHGGGLPLQRPTDKQVRDNEVL